MYGKGLSGAIIMGAVADHKKATLVFGKRLCRLMAAVRGWHYRSHFVDHLVVGNFNRKFKPARTRADWVTSDREHLDAYVSDPLCSFVFTVNAYYSMFSGRISMRERGRLYDSRRICRFCLRQVRKIRWETSEKAFVKYMKNTGRQG